MHRFGNILVIVGIIALVVGVVGVIARLLGWVGVGFEFLVTPWYGPFLGGLLLIIAGRLLERPATPIT